MHIYLFVFQFFITFKIALDMLCMSGCGTYGSTLMTEKVDGWVYYMLELYPK